MKRIAILALDNCMQSSVTGFYDILTVANRLAADMTPPESPPFDPVIVTPDGRPVTSFNGLPISAHMGLDQCRQPDLIYLPVIYGDVAATLDDRALIGALTRLVRRPVMAAGVCAGVFVLAMTGVLDGKEATTHWRLAAEFKARFPGVRLKPEKMLVDEGRVITAGGVTAYMDLALYLVALGSRELAALVSKSLLIDPARASQAPYALPRFDLSHGDESVAELQVWMEAHLAESITLSGLADMAGLGERTLIRRFKKRTGDTPLGYLQNLRLARARQLLETTDHPVDQITWAVGYQDISSFRRLFKQRTGLSPSDYRRRFGRY